ncbi:MAG: hypothetical protein K2X90_02795 [Candidatus Babeliaceae bacterium]|nr:hypothetical protein [Candidatus Babeliaceae bacterium]
MKKQLLLLIAVISSANISAFNLQAYKEYLGKTLSNNTTISYMAFGAVLTYVLYKFYIQGGYSNNPGYDWAAEKCDTPGDTKVIESSSQNPEATSTITPQQSAIHQQDAYWEEFTQRQMEILA